jgi:hypothetical protein
VETLPAGLARPVKIKFMSRQEGSVPPTAAGAGASPMSGTASAPEMTSTTAAAALEGLATTSARSLERTQDLMSLHALQLRASGADSLQVVIKPGPGMQLSLNLQMREGNVEMSATAPRGDFDALNRHWSELQQQLETRGVRLGSLTCSDQPASGDSHSFQQPQRQQADDNTPPAPAFADFALLGSMSLAPTIKTLSQRGWESWA